MSTEAPEIDDVDLTEGSDAADNDSTPPWGDADAEPDPRWDDAADQADMEAADRQAYDDALQVADESQTETGPNGETRLRPGIDPWDVLEQHGRERPPEQPEQPDGKEQMPTRLPESKHGEGNGPGLKGGGGTSKGKRRLFGGNSGGGGKGFTLLNIDLSGWFRGWLSPDIDAGNGNGLINAHGKARR